MDTIKLTPQQKQLIKRIKIAEKDKELFLSQGYKPNSSQHWEAVECLTPGIKKSAKNLEENGLITTLPNETGNSFFAFLTEEGRKILIR